MAGCIDRGLDAVKPEQEVLRKQVEEIQEVADTLDPEEGNSAQRQAQFQELIERFVAQGDSFHFLPHACSVHEFFAQPQSMRPRARTGVLSGKIPGGEIANGRSSWRHGLIPSAHRQPWRSSRTMTWEPNDLPAVPIGIDDIVQAAQRLEPWAHRTPVLTSRTLDERSAAGVFLKCENLQRVGAFKFRGAMNALLLLGGDQKAAGVVTHSSGNHAQALALAGRLLGVPVTIVMPRTAPAVKRAATLGYGADGSDPKKSVPWSGVSLLPHAR